MGRPRKEDNEKRKMIGIRFSPHDLYQLQELASAMGMTVPKFVEALSVASLHCGVGPLDNLLAEGEIGRLENELREVRLRTSERLLTHT